MKGKIVFKLKEDVLTVSFPKEDISTSDYRHFLAEIKKNILEYGPIWVIFNLAKSGYLKAENRVEQIKWAKENEALFKSKVKRIFFIVSNPIVRSMLQASPEYSAEQNTNFVVKNLEEAYSRIESVSVK